MIVISRDCTKIVFSETQEKKQWQNNQSAIAYKIKEPNKIDIFFFIFCHFLLVFLAITFWAKMIEMIWWLQRNLSDSFYSTRFHSLHCLPFSNSYATAYHFYRISKICVQESKARMRLHYTWVLHFGIILFFINEVAAIFSSAILKWFCLWTVSQSFTAGLK